MMDSPSQDAATIQRILEARARALAQPLQTESRVEGSEMVVLALGSERYGVEIKYVQEIRPLISLTRVPSTPTFWAGLVNLRGRLFPVLDLRRYLSLPGNSPSTNGKVILVSAHGLEVGLLADDVLGVRQVASADIAPLVGEASGARREIISGVTSDFLSVIDLEMLLADQKLVVQEEII